MSYKLNSIFIDKYPPEAAVWCGKNNATIEEIEPQDGVRRFQIVAIPEPTLAEVKADALSRIDTATSSAILAGFEYEVDGESLHFSYDSFDQQNFVDSASVATLALSGQQGLPTSVTWNAYRNYTPETGGELVRLDFTPQTFLGLYMQGALAHKGLQMEIGGQRKAAIDAAESVEAVQALLERWGL